MTGSLCTAGGGLETGVQAGAQTCDAPVEFVLAGNADEVVEGAASRPPSTPAAQARNQRGGGAQQQDQAAAAAGKEGRRTRRGGPPASTAQGRRDQVAGGLVIGQGGQPAFQFLPFGQEALPAFSRRICSNDARWSGVNSPDADMCSRSCARAS